MRKKAAEPSYSQHLDTLPAAEAEAVSAFFVRLDRHITLPKREREALINDFKNALGYYVSSGVSLSEALARR